MFKTVFLLQNIFLNLWVFCIKKMVSNDNNKAFFLCLYFWFEEIIELRKVAVIWLHRKGGALENIFHYSWLCIWNNERISSLKPILRLSLLETTHYNTSATFTFLKYLEVSLKKALLRIFRKGWGIFFKPFF